MKINRNIQESVIEFYGKVSQNTICMEECAELIQVISKIQRYGTTVENIEHLKEEMADVYICLGQLRLMHNIKVSDIQYWIDFKQERQLKRIKGESE